MNPGKFLIRPITEEDLGSICDIAAKIGPGFTSLVNDPKLLSAKIKRSVASFTENKKPEFFFFGLEDRDQKKLIGTSAIECIISNQKLFYCYKIDTQIQKSEAIQKTKKHALVLTENHYSSASMLGSLFVHPEHRGHGQGDFLSKIRFLFMADFQNFFSDTLIAEIRAYFDEKGLTPFWEGFNRHFFDMSYEEASYLIASQGPQFIKDLMPQFPIYIFLLPDSIKEIIGKPHPKAQAALHILEKEGFTFQNYVDILDAGPIVEIKIKDIKTLKESSRKKIKGFKTDIEGDVFMISNAKMAFRASLGKIQFISENSEEVYIEKEVAQCLNVGEGDAIRFARFK